MKRIFVIMTVIFALISVNACQAQEWDSIMDSYSKNQIERPVTPQEYNKALETIQSFQKQPKEKKKKKKKKDKENLNMPTPPPAKQEVVIPPSSGLLLRLPVSVRWNNTVIRDGFYLVDKTLNGKNYFLKVMQEGKNIAELPTAADTVKYSGFPEISVKNTVNNTIEIHYLDREASLKAELPIYIQLQSNENDDE